MSAHGYNPEFYSAAMRRRALAEMRRRMREEEEKAQALVLAARASADAILASAHQEARIIMARAYEAQARPRRPVGEIIAEVARERGVPVPVIRGRSGTKEAREARHAAIRRAARERKDLSAAEIARVFGHVDASTVRRVIAAVAHG